MTDSDYSIAELQSDEIPTKNVELAFFKDCALMSCIRFSYLEFENFKKVANLLSLKMIYYGYETPHVNSDSLLRWKNGELETENVGLDCGILVDIQIDDEQVILEFVGGFARVSQDFTFKQWSQFKRAMAEVGKK